MFNYHVNICISSVTYKSKAKAVAFDDGDYFICGLTVGREAKYASLGSDCLFGTAARYIVEHFEELFQSNPQSLKVRLMTMNKIRVEELCYIGVKRGKKLNKNDFKSETFILFAAHSDGRFISLHIGDGQWGYIKDNLLCSVSIIKSETDSTAELKSWMTAIVGKGILKNESSIFIMDINNTINKSLLLMGKYHEFEQEMKLLFSPEKAAVCFSVENRH